MEKTFYLEINEYKTYSNKQHNKNAENDKWNGRKRFW